MTTKAEAGKSVPPAVAEFALLDRKELLSDTADLRARLAKYEDAEGRPVDQLSSIAVITGMADALRHVIKELDAEACEDIDYAQVSGALGAYELFGQSLNASPVSAGWMMPTAKQLEQALESVPSFHDLSAELIAPAMLGHLRDVISAGEYGDAYQGAREDLAIWKRRELEAETKIREQDQIIDNLGNALTVLDGATVKQSLTVGGVDERAPLTGEQLYSCYVKANGRASISVDGWHDLDQRDRCVWDSFAAISAPNHSDQVREADRAGYVRAMREVAKHFRLASGKPGKVSLWALHRNRDFAAAPSAGSQVGDV